MTKLKSDKVTFSIGIETYIANKHEYFSPSQKKLDLPVMGRSKWSAQGDSVTLSAKVPRSHYATQITSPRLKGALGLASIGETAMQLTELKARTNGACALSITVNVGNGKNAKLKRQAIRAWFVHFELAFYGLGGAKGVGTYFQDIPNTPYLSIPSTHWASESSQDDTDKARSLDMTSEKSITFRAFAGAHDLETLITAVYMAVGLVTYATNNMGNELPTGRIEDPLLAAREFAVKVWSDEYTWYKEYGPPVGPFGHLVKRANAFKQSLAIAYGERGKGLPWEKPSGENYKAATAARKLWAEMWDIIDPDEKAPTLENGEDKKAKSTKSTKSTKTPKQSNGVVDILKAYG